MSRRDQTALVWDSVATPPEGYQRIMLWKSFNCESYPDAISIPRLIEENPVELKKQYLKLIYNIGIKKIDGQSVIDHMQIHKNFNYWWMTLIIEKCNYSKSIWINDAICLLAFEKIIKKDNIQNIKLVTSNKLLAKSFRLLCLKYKIEFDWQLLLKVKSSKSIFKRFYELFPLSLKEIASFCFNIVRRWSLRGIGLKEWKSTAGRITFISYYFNLVSESAEKGQYESRYWGHLPDLLLKEGTYTNWLHIYVKDNVCPSEKHAAKLIQKFNETGQEKQIHTTLDTFLGLKVIWNTLLDWVRLFKVGRKIRGLSSIKNDDSGYLWPFIKLDLKKSLYGRTALGNLLNFNLFEEALLLLPKQKKGVYLQENQGWEFGLIQAWKTNGHGDIIGVPHATVRFWDLRYFFDARCYNDQLPLPSQVAVNGELMRKRYVDGGYNKNELIDVEALRYLYLNTDNEKIDNNLKSDTILLLVLGDYLDETTRYQMKLLEEAFPSFSNNINLLVKPHPKCPILSSDYPGLKIEVTMESISTLLRKSNIAFTSNVTSAAIDAYCANVPVISALNPQTLNMSPLRGVNGIKFASNASELVNAIEKIKIGHKNNKKRPEDFFWLTTKLPMWKEIFS